MTEKQKRIKKRLAYLDTIVQRHEEQKKLISLGLLSSDKLKLTEDEYISILVEKQNLREDND